MQTLRQVIGGQNRRFTDALFIDLKIKMLQFCKRTIFINTVTKEFKIPCAFCNRLHKKKFSLSSPPASEFPAASILFLFA